MGLLVQLDPVGSLGHAPGGVAPALDPAGQLQGLLVRVEAGRVLEPEGGIDIIILAVDGFSAFGGDMDRRYLEVRGDGLVVQRVDVRRLGRVHGLFGLLGLPAVVELHRLAVGGPDPQVLEVAVGIEGDAFLQRSVRPLNTGIFPVDEPVRSLPDDRFRHVGEGVGPVLDDPLRRRDDDAGSVLEEDLREGGQGAGFHIGLSVPVSFDHFQEGRGRGRLGVRDNLVLPAGNREEQDSRQEKEPISQVTLHGAKIVFRT